MINYDSLLSPVVTAMPPSGIRKFFDLAAEMEDVISLGVGEPDFTTPWSIREAGIYSLERGRTHYTANSGLLELREEICSYTRRKYDVEYDPKKEVIVTVGGSEAIDIMMRTVIHPGDEVLIPEPSFVCYKPCTVMAGGEAIAIETREEDEFRLRPEQLKEKITPRTKLLVLPYPNNPTGAVMQRADLEAIAEVLRGTDILVLSDEIYGELNYGEEKHTPFSAIDGMKERTVVVNGFSKAFAMTGWRLGYALGPAPIIKQMTKVHQYCIMSAPTTSQFAAIEALRSCDDDVEEMCREYNYRRRYIVDGFRKMGLSCFEPLGAFYVFPCIKSLGMTSEEFCQTLLEEEHVAVVPGNAFGESGEGFIRVSYAYSIENLQAALERIARFVERHKRQ
jgi:aminotransferase